MDSSGGTARRKNKKKPQISITVSYYITIFLLEIIIRPSRKKKLTNKKATGRTPVLVLAYLGSAVGAVAIVPRVASIADLVAAVLVRAHRRPLLHLLAALAAAPAVIRQPLGRPARGADATVYQDVYVDARTAAGPAALHGAVALDCRRTLADVGGFP